MQKRGKLVLSSKWWGHKVPAGPVFAFSAFVLQLSEAHLVEMVPDWAGRSRDAAFEEHIHSFFSWNDALKLEEWIFGKERFFQDVRFCLEVKSACQENRNVNSKHTFHLCKTNITTNGQLRYQHSNRIWIVLKKKRYWRGTDVSETTRRVAREWGSYEETVVN